MLLLVSHSPPSSAMLRLVGIIISHACGCLIEHDLRPSEGPAFASVQSVRSCQLLPRPIDWARLNPQQFSHGCTLATAVCDRIQLKCRRSPCSRSMVSAMCKMLGDMSPVGPDCIVSAAPLCPATSAKLLSAQAVSSKQKAVVQKLQDRVELVSIRMCQLCWAPSCSHVKSFTFTFYV